MVGGGAWNPWNLDSAGGATQAADFLLSEDRGSQAPKRWQQMKKLPAQAAERGSRVMQSLEKSLMKFD